MEGGLRGLLDRLEAGTVAVPFDAAIAHGSAQAAFAAAWATCDEPDTLARALRLDGWDLRSVGMPGSAALVAMRFASDGAGGWTATTRVVVPLPPWKSVAVGREAAQHARMAVVDAAVLRAALPCPTLATMPRACPHCASPHAGL